ncbi:G2E3 ligase, partial [Rhinopomastus cyanomelas]|nr:G2E3 ligase [Rhinopomastus cyanomelas]
CFVCRERGASITCWEITCDRSFHLPCAVQGGCFTQYFQPFRAYCWEHVPQHAAAPDNTDCIICMDPIEDRAPCGTAVCSACQHAWVHRGCLQAYALHAGQSRFRCPLCRDQELFRITMLNMGFYIPPRLPLRENFENYAPLMERHRRCDASNCLCPEGREWEAEDEEGPWKLLLCRSCAAEGTHRCCSGLDTTVTTWECSSC